jgi:hypothetical protein
MASLVGAALTVPLAEARRRALVEGDHRGAGVDHECDALAIDPAFGLEMAAPVAWNAEAARSGLRQRNRFRRNCFAFGGRGRHRCRCHPVGDFRHEGAERDHERGKDH